MTYPGNRPDLDPVNDPARNVDPGGIDRDIADPGRPFDPRADPRMTSGPRGLVGATIAVAVVLLAILAFSFIGGGSSDQAGIPPDGATVEGTDDTSTSAISPGAEGEEIPPIEPNDPAEPVQPAPVQ